MAKKVFSKEFAIDKLGLPYGDSADGYEVEIISDEISDTGRWSVYHDLIFKYDGKFYSTHYSVGATEFQEERPWENEDEVECWEVEPVEKVIIAYVPVKD